MILLYINKIFIFQINKKTDQSNSTVYMYTKHNYPKSYKTLED